MSLNFFFCYFHAIFRGYVFLISLQLFCNENISVFLHILSQIFQEECGKRSAIAALYDKLQTCNDRVTSRKQTEETCAEELFDYMDALNDCVAERLFSKLK